MAAEAPRRAGADIPDTMKLVCSHGGRLTPRDHDGAVRYVGGETRVLAVPRYVPFRELTRRLKEMTGGKDVLAIRHRLADDEGLEDVLVSVTCDEELEHMRDEYDDLLATKPKARFRVFVTTAAAASGVVHRGRSSKPGLPPLPPKTRRAQSEQAPMHRPASYYPAPVRRVQSAQEFAGRLQYCCCCQGRSMCAPAPPPSRMNAVPYMSKKVAASPSMPVAKTAERVVFTDAARDKATSRDSQAAMEGRRTISSEA